MEIGIAEKLLKIEIFNCKALIIMEIGIAENDFKTGLFGIVKNHGHSELGKTNRRRQQTADRLEQERDTRMKPDHLVTTK